MSKMLRMFATMALLLLRPSGMKDAARVPGGGGTSAKRAKVSKASFASEDKMFGMRGGSALCACQHPVVVKAAQCVGWAKGCSPSGPSGRCGASGGAGLSGSSAPGIMRAERSTSTGPDGKCAIGNSCFSSPKVTPRSQAHASRRAVAGAMRSSPVASNMRS